MIPTEEKSKYICLIAAMSENMVIGRGGEIPWNIASDRRMFKEITTGHTVIMGRKTYESIGGTLSKRQNIIVSSTLKTNTAHVVDSLPGALVAATQDKIFLIGGEQIYKEGLKYATHMILTLIHDHVQGDAYFPDFEETQWNVVSHEWVESYSILNLRKRTEEQVLQHNSWLQ